MTEPTHQDVPTRRALEEAYAGRRPPAVLIEWEKAPEGCRPARDHNGVEIVSERYWNGARRSVCCVLVRDPVVGLKAYIDATESAQQTKWHGARVDPGLARAMFPAYASEKWAEW